MASHREQGVAGAQAPGQPALSVVNDKSTKESALLSVLANDFLEWQCRMIAGVMRGVVFLTDNDGQPNVGCAVWPKGAAIPPGALQESAAMAAQSKKPQLRSQVKYTEHKGQICDIAACPVLHENKVVAVISVALATRAESQQQATVKLIEWGTLWFGKLLSREVQLGRQFAPLLLELQEATIQQTEVSALAHEAVELLQKRLDCDRVSLGINKDGRMQLLAVSGLPNVDKKTAFVTRLEDAMEEAADQHVTISFPSDTVTPEIIDRAHRRLSEAHPTCAFYTTAAEEEGERLSLIVEHKKDRPLGKGDKTVLNHAAQTLLGTSRLVRSANSSFASFVNRSQFSIKKRLGGAAGLTALLTCIALALLAAIPGTHKLTADASLISTQQHAIVAPLSGYVKSAEVRPGDDVQANEILATIDTGNLVLEKEKWLSLQGAHQAEYQEALAKHDRTQVTVLRARLDQIAAELALVDAQLSRAVLRAPYTGVIVSGDLSQSLDAPVENGDVLFEVAPLTEFRIVLEVSEFDVASLKPGHEGNLRLAALPNKVLPFVVENIMPLAISGEGRSFFKVEATLLEQPVEVRPGMRGVAKIDAGRESLLWIWTHSVIDRLRLFTWSLGF